MHEFQVEMDQAIGGPQNDGSQMDGPRPDGCSNDPRALVGLVVPVQHIFDRAGATIVFELEAALANMTPEQEQEYLRAE